ncbi:MAG TPA: peptide deformylase [Verrucomicrobiota bacterium]|nr:peptide deformylase [Verrucomicrobiota bacterium]HNU49336.1 peptide deformylase [Verrucomicrobiota bacterium]
MILDIVNYGHPVLRQPGRRIERVTPEIRQLARDMIETMRDAHGVGLAAQQVALALQLTVLDVTEVTDRPSTLEREGKPADVQAFMPLVLINPELTPFGPPASGPEGCLSFPGIFGDITRPESVEVSALDEHGEPLSFRCGGLLARAIQHEHDHLRGILFIDRMSSAQKRELQPELDDLQAATRAALAKTAGRRAVTP